MKSISCWIKNKLCSLAGFPPLFFRLILAYGFYEPAMKKLNNFENIVSWFTSMEIPYPETSAYLATGTEALGVVFLAVGFMTRLISIPLSFVMMVAIYYVHWDKGFPASQGGIEIPLYYMLMLFSLITTGPGLFSVDCWIHKKCCYKKEGAQCETKES
ncbi:MAG: DoxX family protein [Waddliaceae bacterium]|nr:DoxX family protein [Waddliaceae bacterium]